MATRREFLDALAVGAAGLAVGMKANSYGRILGELPKLGIHSISKPTIRAILRAHEIDPAPNRGEQPGTSS